jgi:hypothetical protein
MKHKRKIFLMGNLYECNGLIVMCSETTDNYSSNNFKGVVLLDNENKYTRGHYSETWFTETFRNIESEVIHLNVKI